MDKASATEKAESSTSGTFGSVGRVVHDNGRYSRGYIAEERVDNNVYHRSVNFMGTEHCPTKHPNSQGSADGERNE